MRSSRERMPFFMFQYFVVVVSGIVAPSCTSLFSVDFRYIRMHSVPFQMQKVVIC